MATNLLSRNAFTTPGQQSLADLIGRIELTPEIPKVTRQNWRWALRTIARVAGKEPAAIPAHPTFLRRLIAKSAPVAASLGAGAWNNAKSLTTKALEWDGQITVLGRYLAAYTPEWNDLWTRLPAKQALAVQLGRLFHYCSANDVRPTDVDDAVLSGFYLALEEESLIGKPYEAYRAAAKSWNNALARIAGWPGTPVTVPSKRAELFSLPWEDFPESLRSQVEGHLEALGGLDLGVDFGQPMKPATIEKRRKQLRWFASALVRSGVELSVLDRLEVLLAPVMARRGLDYLLKRRDGKSFPELANFAEFMPALARRLGLPDETIKTLTRFRKKLKLKHTGLADRHRETLQRFDDSEAVAALVNLPQRLLKVVQGSRRKGAQKAKLLQTAVAIDLLLAAAPRIGNLASIEVGRHLLVVQTEPKGLHLRFPAGEVKNEVDLEYPLSPETVELINLYLEEFRDLLAKEPGEFLFPGKWPGRHKVEHALSSQIRKTVFKYTGLDMPAHRFRHALAKIFLDRNPGQYEVVRQFLGHKNIKTTIDFYAGAETAAAARHFAATILKLRNPNKDGEDETNEKGTTVGKGRNGGKGKKGGNDGA